MIGGAYLNMGAGASSSNYKWLGVEIAEIKKTDKCYVIKSTKGYTFFMSHSLNNSRVNYFNNGDRVMIRVSRKWYDTSKWRQNPDKRGFFDIKKSQY